MVRERMVFPPFIFSVDHEAAWAMFVLREGLMTGVVKIDYTMKKKVLFLPAGDGVASTCHPVCSQEYNSPRI
jgi:hypothetical protein